MISRPARFIRPARRRRAQRGALMVELVIAVAVTGLIVVGMQGAIIVSLRSMPTSNSGGQTALRASQILDQLATEMETAIYVTEHTATTLGFTVPDRNGDGIAERIRYAWTGTPGGPLTRQYNGGTTVTLADHVDLFSLTPASKSVTETYPSVGVEDAAESLLIDAYGTSGTADNDVTVTNWVGQYFTMTLPAGAYAWRPTRVDFVVKRGALIGATLVQMRPATATLVPAGSIIEQYTLWQTLLSGSYAWQSFNFLTIDPIPSGGAICLVLQQQFGSPSLTAQSSSACPGLETTSNSGSSWTYNGGKGLVSRLYGKLTRSSGTQSLNSKYLTSLSVAIRMTPSSAMLNTTVALLNHPELLSGKWELKFDRNPTTVDVNGDGAGDWLVNGGGAFNTATLVNGVWQTSGTQLNTSPSSDFAKTTVVDLKFQNTSVGGSGATFTINALRSGVSCAPISASLAKQADGTQTLSISTKLTDVLTKKLVTISGLPNQPVLLHLIFDPVTSSVSTSVNNVPYGTFSLIPFASTDGSRFAACGASGSTAEFSYARIRVLEQ